MIKKFRNYFFETTEYKNEQEFDRFIGGDRSEDETDVTIYFTWWKNRYGRNERQYTYIRRINKDKMATSLVDMIVDLHDNRVFRKYKGYDYFSCDIKFYDNTFNEYLICESDYSIDTLYEKDKYRAAKVTEIVEEYGGRIEELTLINEVIDFYINGYEFFEEYMKLCLLFSDHRYYRNIKKLNAEKTFKNTVNYLNYLQKELFEHHKEVTKNEKN